MNLCRLMNFKRADVFLKARYTYIEHLKIVSKTVHSRTIS